MDKAMKASELRMGQRVYAFECVWHFDERQKLLQLSRVNLLKANFVGRRGSWIRLRDLRSGREWSDRATLWHADPRDAAEAEALFVCLSYTVGDKEFRWMTLPTLALCLQMLVIRADDEAARLNRA